MHERVKFDSIITGLRNRNLKELDVKISSDGLTTWEQEIGKFSLDEAKAAIDVISMPPEIFPDFRTGQPSNVATMLFRLYEHYLGLLFSLAATNNVFWNPQEYIANLNFQGVSELIRVMINSPDQYKKINDSSDPATRAVLASIYKKYVELLAVKIKTSGQGEAKEVDLAQENIAFTELQTKLANFLFFFNESEMQQVRDYVEKNPDFFDLLIPLRRLIEDPETGFLAQLSHYKGPLVPRMIESCMVILADFSNPHKHLADKFLATRLTGKTISSWLGGAYDEISSLVPSMPNQGKLYLGQAPKKGDVEKICPEKDLAKKLVIVSFLTPVEIYDIFNANIPNFYSEPLVGPVNKWAGDKKITVYTFACLDHSFHSALGFTLDDLIKLFVQVSLAKQAGADVLFHCFAGKERSVVGIALFILYEALTAKGQTRKFTLKSITDSLHEERVKAKNLDMMVEASRKPFLCLALEMITKNPQNLQTYQAQSKDINEDLKLFAELSKGLNVGKPEELFAIMNLLLVLQTQAKGNSDIQVINAILNNIFTSIGNFLLNGVASQEPQKYIDLFLNLSETIVALADRFDPNTKPLLLVQYMSILDQFDEKYKRFSQTEPRGVWIKDVDKGMEKLVATVRQMAAKFPDQQIVLPNFAQKFGEQKVFVSLESPEVPKLERKE